MPHPLRYLCYLGFALLLPALAGCSGAASIEDLAQPAPYIRLSPISPPDTPYEERLRPENPTTEIWRPGYWRYNGLAFTWEPGYLMQRPSPTAMWSPDHWEKREYGWAFVKGYWQ